jgi:hypothetical protein
MVQRGRSLTRTFRERFCEYYGCSDESFASVALGKFLYPPWSILAPVLLKALPGLFRTDLRIVQQLGYVTSRDALLSEVRELHADYVRNRDFGVARRFFRLRLSGSRILQRSRYIWDRSSKMSEAPR